jgi:hypothetical protein
MDIVTWGEKKMPRLIDADEAYKVLTDYYHIRTEIQHKALKEAMERVPTVDAVEVVRCKDCKFGEYDEDFPNQYYCPNWGCAFRSDWFCADGERREDA